MAAGRMVAAATAWAMIGGTAGAAEVWSRTTQSNGTAFYVCSSGDCGRDATLTCRMVPAETVTTSEQFTARVDEQIADLRAVGREIEARPATRTAMGERVLFRIALFYGSGAPAFETGVLAGAQDAFAVVSTAADAKTMKRNFDRFVTQLGKQPVAAAVAECPP